MHLGQAIATQQHGVAAVRQRSHARLTVQCELGHAAAGAIQNAQAHGLALRCVALGVFAGAMVGPRVARRTAGPALRRYFAPLMLGVAALMLIKSIGFEVGL